MVMAADGDRTATGARGSQMVNPHDCQADQTDPHPHGSEGRSAPGVETRSDRGLYRLGIVPSAGPPTLQRSMPPTGLGSMPSRGREGPKRAPPKRARPTHGHTRQRPSAIEAHAEDRATQRPHAGGAIETHIRITSAHPNTSEGWSSLCYHICVAHVFQQFSRGPAIASGASHTPAWL